MSGEHKVHPYLSSEIPCRGESSIRPICIFFLYFEFSDSLLSVECLVKILKYILIIFHLIPNTKH